jgi:hypothetical protein
MRRFGMRVQYDTDAVRWPDRYEYYRDAAASKMAPVAIRPHDPGWRPGLLPMSLNITSGESSSRQATRCATARATSGADVVVARDLMRLPVCMTRLE